MNILQNAKVNFLTVFETIKNFEILVPNSYNTSYADVQDSNT